MTIIESNKLIAKFMGMTGTDEFIRQNYHYERDWNLLMLVIEKISKEPLIGAESHHDVCYPVTFNMPHTDGTVMVRLAGFGLHHGTTLIEAAYAAVVEFVEFHQQHHYAQSLQNKP